MTVKIEEIVTVPALRKFNLELDEWELGLLAHLVGCFIAPTNCSKVGDVAKFAAEVKEKIYKQRGTFI